MSEPYTARMTLPIQLVLVSCPPAQAEELATELINARLAACVNIIPQMRSVYRWQDKLDSAEESLLIIKTATDRFEALKQAVLKLHPYELPEIIGVNLSEGHAPYLDWILASTRPHENN